MKNDLGHQKDRSRTGISLTPVIDKIAAEMMKKKGFNNFSAYIADLIRRDKERDEERELIKTKAKPPQSADKPKKERAG